MAESCDAPRAARRPMNPAQPGDELVFLPLGGSGEIGMNLNAYGFGPAHNRKWIIVDVGVTFGGPQEPGIDLIMPDPEFLEGEKDNILAIILTHAHEDHIGAIGWLWPRLKAPLYATPFTAALIVEKLRERGLDKKAPLHVVPLKGSLSFGPFEIEFVTLTHSIPEPNGLMIRTPLGVVFHTGDWKIDPDPMIGEQTDFAALDRMRQEGVLAMICDSTNVFVEGHAGSEADVRAGLIAALKTFTGKVAITAFASNVARVESAYVAARTAGRQVCLVGRSMHRIVGAAKATGVLPADLNFITEEEAAAAPDENVLYLCTGSQGEERAALSRIASGDHRRVKLGEGDVVLFSSRVIPGNESAIFALYEKLNERGVQVMTDKDAPIHVSGHPCRDELRQMYSLVRPRIAVAVHGERRHILEHVKLAQELQTPEAVAPRNGDMIRLAPGAAEIIDEVPSGRLYVDGAVLIKAEDETMRERKKLAQDGAVTVTIVASAKKHIIIGGPEIRAVGLASEDDRGFDKALEDIAEAAEKAYSNLSNHDRGDEDIAEEIISRAVRRAAERAWGKRPLVETVLMVV
jgi:ribonuclease J